MNKNKIAIVVDSGMDVPKSYLENYDLFELPLQINYKDQSYLDRINIQPEEVCARLEEEIPKTSLPSGQSIHQLFQDIINKGYEHVIVCSISSQLSGTFQLLKTMAEDFDSLQFTFFDTKNIGIGAGLFAVQAAELADVGYSVEDIKNKVFDPLKSHVFFMVDTLKYLKAGGRIGSVQANIGELLKIKPVITCDDEGIYTTYKKIRSDRQFDKLIMKQIEIAIHQFGEENIRLAIAEVEAKERAHALMKHIKENHPSIEYIISTVSPALCVHTGPGLIGVAIYHK